MKVSECPSCVKYILDHKYEIIQVSDMVSQAMGTPQKRVILAYISAYHHNGHSESNVFEKYVLGVGLDNVSEA